MRNNITLQRFFSLVTPGALVLFVAWGLQQEESIRRAAIPYAPWVCFATLAASALLSWYHNYARALSASVLVGLAIWTFAQSPDEEIPKLAVAFFVPVNLAFFAILKERGVMTLSGAVKACIVGLQLLAMPLLQKDAPGAVRTLLQWGDQSSYWTWIPWSGRISFLAVGAFLLILVCIRRTSVEAGLFWALVAMFIALDQINVPGALYFYACAAGLVLMFAVLEHGFDMAYRDELTGLPGRRAFNEVLQQLGRRYTIAMCDVDNFKKFNDTYGHDAGDQILKRVAATLVGVKGGGRAFRYGGEEFALVFKGCSAAEVQPFVESMRDAIAQMDVVLHGREHPLEKTMRKKGSPAPTTSVNITISVGMADNSTSQPRPELVLENADAALYRAKESGKNCVKLVDGVPA